MPSSGKTAFVDTTVLTDAAMKSGDRAETARAALRRYARTELPVYAIKELKAGPLTNVAWMHNKFVEASTCKEAIDALQRVALGPRRYLPATALEGIGLSIEAFTKMMPADLEDKYGPLGSLDELLRAHFQFELRRVVYRAWRKRRRITTVVVGDLSCYSEQAPRIDSQGKLVLDSVKCRPPVECCLGNLLRQRMADLKRLIAVLPATGGRPEQTRRRKALRQLARFPKQPMTEETCRDLAPLC